MKNLIAVMVGGALGSALRYATTLLLPRLHVQSFPVATFLVNIIGCILIGTLAAFFDKHITLPPIFKLLLITGFCGGFTTFSAFAIEQVQMIEQGHWASAALYFTSTTVVSILAAYAGFALLK